MTHPAEAMMRSIFQSGVTTLVEVLSRVQLMVELGEGNDEDGEF